jgi:hypothetical protein
MWLNAAVVKNKVALRVFGDGAGTRWTVVLVLVLSLQAPSSKPQQP